MFNESVAVAVKVEVKDKSVFVNEKTRATSSLVSRFQRRRVKGFVMETSLSCLRPEVGVGGRSCRV